MTGNMSDQELVIAVQNGDIRAYELLVGRYQQRVFSFILRYVFDEESAKDLTQEVLFRVYTIIDKIDVSRKFSTLLFEIAKNKAIDYIRSHKSTLSLDSLEIMDDAPAVDEMFFQEEEARRLREAVSRLPQQYRLVITLYYIEELSYQQISERLSLPLNTVRTHLRRGKEQLLTLLQTSNETH